jgi:hypothetical protein
MNEGEGILSLLARLLLLPLARIEGFKYLPPLEQNLQRITHAVAVPVTIFVAAVLFFGTAAPLLFVHLFTNFADTWPLAAAVFGLIPYCMVRFRLGWRNLVVYDPNGTLAKHALARLIISIGALVWLLSHYASPWATDWAFFFLRLAVVAAIWGTITSAGRYLLLTRPSISAKDIVEEHIAETQFQWDQPQLPAPPRWWEFWKKPT